jgi:hypothetical protein
MGMCSLDGRSWTATDAILREEKQASLEGSLPKDDTSFDALSKSHLMRTLSPHYS